MASATFPKVGASSRDDRARELEMGAFARKGSLSDDLEEIYATFPILKDRRKQLDRISRGRAANARDRRALMSKPRLLLLDEPSMGLAPMIIDQIFSIISHIRERYDNFCGGAKRSAGASPR